jgi:hypothetical protein
MIFELDCFDQSKTRAQPSSDRAGCGGQITIIPPALIFTFQVVPNAKLLLPLTNNKWPLGVDPGGHRFVD